MLVANINHARDIIYGIVISRIVSVPLKYPQIEEPKRKLRRAESQLSVEWAVSEIERGHHKLQVFRRWVETAVTETLFSDLSKLRHHRVCIEGLYVRVWMIVAPNEIDLPTPNQSLNRLGPLWFA